MKKIILSIDGMTCSACSNGLRKILKQTKWHNRSKCKFSYGKCYYNL